MNLFKKKRLDTILLERGLEITKARARARILSGDVIVGEHRIDKPGTLISDHLAVRFKKKSIPYVSRGGIKLEAALESWPMPDKNTVCIDIGASTGGFTEVLLKHDARLIYAVDVGINQIAYKLRIDPRVHVFEKTHILKIPIEKLNPKPSIATIDVSFISIKKILPSVINCLTFNALLYVLIKPQFETNKKNLLEKGILKNRYAREQIRNNILKFFKSKNLKLIGYKESPIQGLRGNIEYLACFYFPESKSFHITETPILDICKT